MRTHLASRPKAIVVVFAWVVLVLASLATAHALMKPGVDGPITNPIDFRAFYCGSRVAASGANPYLVEPLRTCERDALRSVRLVWNPGLAVPAPLPPYALAAFVPVALLPFPIASQIWFAVLLLCLAGSVLLTQRLSGLPPLAVALALVLALGTASLVNGQIVPIVVCSMCAGGLLLRAGKANLAVLAMGVSAIEPHVALPSLLAVFIWSKEGRRALLTAAATLAAVSIAFCGPRTVWLYLAAVLPAHAQSELTNFSGQYSLSAALHQFGVSDGIALVTGDLSYVVAAAIGIALARKLAARFGDPAFYATAPAAVGILGGTFVHIHQMPLALPLALMLLPKARAQIKVALATVILALAIPWQTFAESHLIADRHPLQAPRPSTVVSLPVAAENSLAEVSWEARVRTIASRKPESTAELLAIKAPTWMALIALVGLAWRFGRRLRAREALLSSRP